MKLACALALVLPLCAPAARAATTEPPLAQEAGTTVLGDGEAPAGMFIAPWQADRPSDIDWPPRILEEPPAALDPQAAQRRMRLDAERAAWRRASLQDH